MRERNPKRKSWADMGRSIICPDKVVGQDMDLIRKLAATSAEIIESAIINNETAYVVTEDHAEDGKRWVPIVAMMRNKVDPELVEDIIVKIARGGCENIEYGAHLCRNTKDELTLSSEICLGDKCRVSIRDCRGHQDHQIGSVHYHPGNDPTPSIGDLLHASLLASNVEDDSPLGVDDNYHCNVTLYPRRRDGGDTALLTCLVPKVIPGKSDAQIGAILDYHASELMDAITSGTLQGDQAAYNAPVQLNSFDLYQIPLFTQRAIRDLEMFVNPLAYAKTNTDTWKIDYATIHPDKIQTLKEDMPEIVNLNLTEDVESVNREFNKMVNVQKPDSLMSEFYREIKGLKKFLGAVKYDTPKEEADMLELADAMIEDFKQFSDRTYIDSSRLPSNWHIGIGPCNARTMADTMRKISLINSINLKIDDTIHEIYAMGAGPIAGPLHVVQDDIAKIGYSLDGVLTNLHKYCKVDIDDRITGIIAQPTGKLNQTKITKGVVIK